MMLRELASAECMPAPTSETVELLIECFRPFADTTSVRRHPLYSCKNTHLFSSFSCPSPPTSSHDCTHFSFSCPTPPTSSHDGTHVNTYYTLLLSYPFA